MSERCRMGAGLEGESGARGRRCDARRLRPGGSPNRRTNRGWTLLATATIAAPASADIVAAWSFNELDPTVGWYEATTGDGFLDLGPLVAIAEEYDGTTMNAPDDWKSGDALGFRGRVPESGAMILGASLGLPLPDQSRSFELSFASRRSTTGVQRLRIDRWSGSTWEFVQELSMETGWAIESVRIPEDEGIAELVLRIAPVGASGSSGTFRIDNLRIDSVVVPAPAVSAVLLGGGIASRAGRRRP